MFNTLNNLYSCILVDNGPLAQDMLEPNISRIEALHLATKCIDAYEAMNMLHKQK